MTRDSRALHEPVVALSDLALAVETGAFAWRLAREKAPSTDDRRAHLLKRWFTVFFASSAAAALAGAAAHGLTESDDDPRRLTYWRASLGAIGVTSLATWHLAAVVAPHDGSARSVPLPIRLIHLGYLVVVLRTRPPFWLALALYAPAAFALRLGFLTRLRIPRERGPSTVALLGLTVSTAAGLVQRRKVAIHPRLFDHNATFHALQAVAFALIFRAASAMIRSQARQ